MNKFFACLAVGAFGLLSACSSVPNNRVNYTPPSVGQVKTAVARAQDTTSQAQRHVTSAATHVSSNAKRLAAAAAAAKTVKQKLDVIAKAVEPQPAVLTLVTQVTSDVDTLTQDLLAAVTENDQVRSDLVETQTQLTNTQSSLTGANARADELQTQVSTQTALLNDSNTKLNAAILQGQKDKHNAHVFKWIIIGCAAAIAALLVYAVFGAAALAPPMLYALLGLPAAVTTFLFFFLG